MSSERLATIEEKLDKVLEQQGEIKVDLKYHIKRTDLLETEVGSLRKYVYMGLGIAIAVGVLLKAIL